MNSQATSMSPSDPMSDGIRIVGVESFKEQMREFSKVIAARAYDIYERRGREEGHAVEDWIRAESELRCLTPIGILESPDQLEVNSRLPGFKANEIEIGIEPRRLFIRAQKEQARIERSGEPGYPEGFNGIFREVDLPDQVDPTRVAVTFKSGNLCLTLSRAFA